MKIVCDGLGFFLFVCFFGSFSTDSKVTWQKVDAWSFNKGEIEIYKPLSSYLVHFLGRKIKQGAVHVACPVRDSCPAPSGLLAGFTVSLEVPHLVVDPFSWIPKGFPTHSDDISQQRLCIHWALTKESWTQHRPRLPAEGWSGRGCSWVGLSLSPTRRVIIDRSGFCSPNCFRFSLHWLANPLLSQASIKISNSLY